MQKNYNHQLMFEFISLVYHKLLEPYHNSFKDVLSPLQFYTLCVINFNGKSTMTNLSKTMKIPKQNMTKIIDKLIDIGFVERVKDITDKRITNITLSKVGIEYLLKNTEDNALDISKAVHSISEEDAENFYSSINTLNNILINIPNWSDKTEK